MWKADIDSAFRRIPIKKSHRDLAWTAWRTGNKVGMAKHYCMPFGAIASVHYWDRIGMAMHSLLPFLHACYLVLRCAAHSHRAKGLTPSGHAVC